MVFFLATTFLFFLVTGFFLYFLKNKEKEIFKLQNSLEQFQTISSKLEEKIVLATESATKKEATFIKAEEDLRFKLSAIKSYETIINESNTFFFNLDAEFAFTFSNEHFAIKMGYSQDEILQLRLKEFLSPKDLEFFLDFSKDPNQNTVFSEFEFIDRFNEKVSIGTQFTKKLNPNGELESFICVGNHHVKISTNDNMDFLGKSAEEAFLKFPCLILIFNMDNQNIVNSRFNWANFNHEKLSGNRNINFNGKSLSQISKNLSDTVIEILSIGSKNIYSPENNVSQYFRIYPFVIEQILFVSLFECTEEYQLLTKIEEERSFYKTVLDNLEIDLVELGSKIKQNESDNQDENLLIKLDFTKFLSITEGDMNFMANLFHSYFNSLNECVKIFSTHINNQDIEGIKFFLHKIRATINTFQIIPMEIKFEEAIRKINENLLFTQSDKTKLISEMEKICIEVENQLRNFARENDVKLK